MKRTYRIGLMILPVLVLLLAGCPAKNQFGGSVDISRICVEAACTELFNNPAVSIYGDTALTGYLEVTNSMSGTTTEPGQTVRTRRVEVTYTTPNGQGILPHVQNVVANIGPAAKLTVPVQIFSFEQMEYVRTHLGAFPDTPFGVGCGITLFYDTSGGQTGSVQRNLSILVTN